MYESVDKNKLYFEYVGPIKDVSFYEYMDSKELFNELKDICIRFNDTRNNTIKKQELLNKINEVKIGNKTPEQKEVINNLENFYKSREVFNFLVIILNCSLMLVTKQNKM